MLPPGRCIGGRSAEQPGWSRSQRESARALRWSWAPSSLQHCIGLHSDVASCERYKGVWEVDGQV